MTLEEMKRRKQELGYSYARLSELSGVPVPTIQKYFSGSTTSPRYDTISALSRVLEEPGTLRSDRVAETAQSYMAKTHKHQGEYTLEDYYALPDEMRAELIDGVFYDMTSPASFHQLAAGLIYHQLVSFIEERNGSCIPFIAPMDVQLDCDDRTMVQPDVLIVCREELIRERVIYGAPDFVVEVLSPSTSRKDAVIKLSKYEHAGVREYWMIDPYNKHVLVYVFEDPTCCPAIYPIDAQIPVRIYDKEAQICLAKLMKWLPRQQ